MKILAFGDRPTIREWQTHGLDCAIYWGFCSFCGFVRLPPGHVDRVLAEAYDEVARPALETRLREQGLNLPMRHTLGYDAINLAELPVELTYGPDEQGWVGFDTGHHNDNWTDDEIRRELEPVEPVAYAEFLIAQEGMRNIVGYEALPPGRTSIHRGLPAHTWTMSELVTTVEDLAGELLRRHPAPANPEEAK